MGVVEERGGAEQGWEWLNGGDKQNSGGSG